MNIYRRRHLSKDWRQSLPAPSLYYPKYLSELRTPGKDGWATAKCPFHDDTFASLSVQLVAPHGGWKCFAGCGSGDLISFHKRLTGKDFIPALCDLIRKAKKWAT